MGIENYSEDIIVVTLSNGLELENELKAVNEIVSEKCDYNVVVDFMRVETLNSSSICNLMILDKFLSGYGHKLILCNVSLPIKGIFTVTGLEDSFEFAEDKYIALESLQGIDKEADEPEPTKSRSRKKDS